MIGGQLIDTHMLVTAEQMIINAASVKHVAALNIYWECAAWHNTVVDRCDLLQTAVKNDVVE